MLPGDEDRQGDQLPHGFIIAKRYDVESFIGTGGMGTVYLAYDRLLERHVAMKVLHKEFIRDQNLTKRFMREVKLMHTVNHPNVVRTYDIGVEENLVYYTMELVQGCMLDEYLRRVGNHYSIIARLFVHLCRGLEAIHKAKIVHRDLKPSNILVADEGCVKITDFGVARPTTSTFTAHREIMGSLDYLPPEIVTGGEISISVDFYSLGIILYEATTGIVPFEADDLATLMWMHVHKMPEEPRTIKRDVPEWLNSLIMQLIQKQPFKRPRTAAEIIKLITPHLTNDITLSSEEFGSSEILYTIQANRNEPGSEEKTQRSPETNAQVTTQDALNNILFDVLPTMNEILEHEKKFSKEKVKRMGQGDEAPSDAEEKAREVEEIQEMRMLRRSVYVLSVVMIIVLGTLAYFLYKYIADVSSRKTEYWFPRGDSPSISDFQASGQPNEQQSAQESTANPSAVFNADAALLAVERFKRKFASNPSPAPGNVENTSVAVIPPQSSPESQAAVEKSSEESQAAVETTISQGSGNVVRSQQETPARQDPPAQQEPLQTWQRAVPFGVPQTAGPAQASGPAQATGPIQATGAKPASKPINAPNLSRMVYTPDLEPKAFNAAESAPKEKTLAGLFNPFEKFFATPESAFSVTKASADAKNTFDRMVRIERSMAELDIQLSVGALGTGERLKKRLREAEAEGISLADAEEQLGKRLSEDRKRYDYWSYLAASLDDKDILSLSRQLEGVSPELEERREAYSNATSEYLGQVEPGTQGPKDVKAHEASGKAVELARKALRDEVAKIIEKSLGLQIASTINRSMAIRAIQEKKRQLAIELRLLETAATEPVPASVRDAKRAEREELEGTLTKLKATLAADDEGALRRTSAMEPAQ